MMDTLKLCVSCKACRHECPTGVDMAKMKIEVLAARAARHGLSLRDRLVGYLPRYAALASRLAPLANLRNSSPLLRKLFEKFAGISAQRALPEWRRDVFKSDAEAIGPADGREVVLFADTFNRAYERENLDAALRVLVEAGYRVHIPKPADRRQAVVLRPDVSLGRPGRSRPRRTRPAGRDLRAVRRARRADRRPRAELPADAARRIAVAAIGRHRPRASARMRCCSRNFWCARPRPAACRCRSDRSRRKPWCMATATRNHSARSSRSSRCFGWSPA